MDTSWAISIIVLTICVAGCIIDVTLHKIIDLLKDIHDALRGPGAGQ